MLPELCAVIDKFITEFDSTHHHDSLLTAVQVQPSLLRVVLDTKAVCNYHHLRIKALGHAVLRVAATRDYISSDDGYRCALCIQRPRTSILNLSSANFFLTLTNTGVTSNWLNMTWRYKLLLPVSIWIPSKWVLCLGRPHRRCSIHFGCYGMTQPWNLSSSLLF